MSPTANAPIRGTDLGEKRISVQMRVESINGISSGSSIVKLLKSTAVM